MTDSKPLVIQKLGLLQEASWAQPGKPTRIILHHTAGATLKGAEQTLKQRGLGYHYMIDRDGTRYQYYRDTAAANHAKYNNRRTIGISLVGGGGTRLNDIQVDSLIVLMRIIIDANPLIVDFSSHREVDAHTPAPSGKVDPDFADFHGVMDRIAEKTGLKRFRG